MEWRKQRTRNALIKAAQWFIAEGKVNAPVLEITQAAGVGTGSFYNHFDSKEELFEAAVADVLDAHGAVLDRLTASLEDPAETFATSFRLTGRLFRQRPQESEILSPMGWPCCRRNAAWPRVHCATSRLLPPQGGFASTTRNLHSPSPVVRCWDSASC